MLLGLLLLFFVVQMTRLGGVEDEIEAQQRTNNAIQDEIDGLEKYEDLQVLAQQRQALLDAAYQNELSFSQALMDLSRITPSDSYVNSFGLTMGGAPATDTGDHVRGEHRALGRRRWASTRWRSGSTGSKRSRDG